MNMSIFNILMSIEGIWRFGAFAAWKFLGMLLLLLATAQLLWQFWRWIDDAETREEGNGDKADFINKSKRRRVFCGNLFAGRPFQVSKNETAHFWLFVIIVGGIVIAVCIGLWPIIMTAGLIYGFGQAARGFRRLQKTIAKMLATLKNKAEKDHDHDIVKE